MLTPSCRYKAFRGDTVYGWSHISDWAYAHGCYDTWYKITYVHGDLPTIM